MIKSCLQRVFVTVRQKLRLIMIPAAPYRTDCVDHIFTRQFISTRDLGSTCFAAVKRTAFRQKLFSCRPMDRSIDTSAAENEYAADMYQRSEPEWLICSDLKAYAESLYTDAEYEKKRQKYAYARPFTKESLLYREIFERHYPGQAEMIKDYWMPNREWEGCNVDDPSARVLSNYGASGN